MMTEKDYEPSVELKSLMLDFQIARSQEPPMPPEGERWLTKAMCLELAILQARLTLARHVSYADLPTSNAVRLWVQDQELSDIFMEAINSLPYGEDYIAALIHGAIVPESGFAIKVASESPLRLRFAYEPPPLVV